VIINRQVITDHKSYVIIILFLIHKLYTKEEEEEATKVVASRHLEIVISKRLCRQGNATQSSIFISYFLHHRFRSGGSGGVGMKSIVYFVWL